MANNITSTNNLSKVTNPNPFGSGKATNPIINGGAANFMKQSLGDLSDNDSNILFGGSKISKDTSSRQKWDA